MAVGAGNGIGMRAANAIAQDAWHICAQAVRAAIDGAVPARSTLYQSAHEGIQFRAKIGWQAPVDCLRLYSWPNVDGGATIALVGLATIKRGGREDGPR